MKKLLSLLLVMVLTLSVVACNSANKNSGAETNAETNKSTASAETPEFVTLGTSSSGGTFNTLGVALCQLYNDNMDTTFSAEVTGGSSENCIRVGGGEIQSAFSAASSVYEATSGTGAFEGNKVEGIKVVANLYPAVMQFPVSKTSGIESLTDIKGKKINIGQSGSGSESQVLNILKSYNISTDDFDAQHLSHSNAVDALTNDKIDGYLISGSLGQSHQMTAMSTGKCNMASFGTEAEINKLIEDYPYYYNFTIPKDAYPNQQSDISTVATGTLLIVNENMPEELVYNMTKTLFENIDTLAASQKIANEINLEEATNIAGLELHPGAEKYFKEVGAIK